jgi:uncharacterized protein YfkK (UPF0435 family)
MANMIVIKLNDENDHEILKKIYDHLKKYTTFSIHAPHNIFEKFARKLEEENVVSISEEFLDNDSSNKEYILNLTDHSKLLKLENWLSFSEGSFLFEDTQQ